ncbi:MAG: hypothetical protein JW818_20390 [Pirellulales bacterium]|nr:hypothetical protein [Pirellulales bacterium]
MEGYRRVMWLAVVAGLFSASGAHCPRFQPPGFQQMGRPVLSPEPTLAEVIETVNRNSSPIKSISAANAKISSPDMPTTLRASIAIQRPYRFRLRAGTAMTGEEVDLGSNDALFWFWARRDANHAAYWCRHDQFDQSQARQMIPIAPAELIAALGMAELDPALAHQGPFRRPDGRIEVHTIRDMPTGPMRKVTVVDPQTGYVVEQQLYDSGNRLLVSALARDHRVDPLSGLVMPKEVYIRCPENKFEMDVKLGNVAINTLQEGTEPIWEMPRFDAQLVNLGDPNVRFIPASASRERPRGAPRRAF